MDLFRLPERKADYRISYGSGPSQFGDLWLPKVPGEALLPVVVFFHGGWWKSKYDLGYVGDLCAALKGEGIACWSIEYRRVGETGGGWPETFKDAAAGFDFVDVLARTYPLDLSRVITMGHSAGGHLAFWIAGRANLSASNELYLPRPFVSLLGTIALAGAVDLSLIFELAGEGEFAHDREEVRNLMSGGPEEYPERYRSGNPGDLLPFSRQALIQGSLDDQIPPELPHRWAELSQGSGSRASVKLLEGLDHFDVVDPSSAAWPVVLHETCKMLFGDAGSSSD